MKINELLECNFEILLVNNKKDNKIIIKGKSVDLLVGISFLASQLKKAGLEAEDIKMAVEIGLKDDKEMENEARTIFKKMLDKLF